MPVQHDQVPGYVPAIDEEAREVWLRELAAKTDALVAHIARGLKPMPMRMWASQADGVQQISRTVTEFTRLNGPQLFPKKGEP